MAPVLLEVLLAGCCHVNMDLTHHGLQGVLDSVWTGHGELVDELARHRNKSLLGPWQEPVDGAAIDETRELLGSAAELGTYWTEAQADVQLVAHSAKEEVIQVVPSVHYACMCTA